MTDQPDVTLAQPEDFPHLNGARYRSARLARLRRKHGRVMRRPEHRGIDVPRLTDPLADLMSNDAMGYPEAEN